MEEPIEDMYFDWLCAKVKRDRTATYLELLRILHRHQFVPVHSADENRVADAIELRDYFLSETGVDVESTWYDSGVSILEVLISFSERASFQINMSPQEWFWQFMTNLRLDEYRRVTSLDRQDISDILDRFVMRNYEPNGDGGLFPLRRPKHDQREVEIWYQFCEYVDDHGLLYGLI